VAALSGWVRHNTAPCCCLVITQLTLFLFAATAYAAANACSPSSPARTRSDGIVRWVKKKTGPAAADMADKAALAAAEKEAEVLVLGYFTETKVR
jgi:hypothetical protein